MSYTYGIKKIGSLINDIVEDLTGQSAALQTLETTDITSLGKAIANANLTEGFFSSLVNRLAKTVYFIRVYDPDRARSILRDEHEYGAFVQKVYYTAPAFTDNPEYGIPDATSGNYTQSSPYDVSGTVTVTAKIFDAQGTFAIEIVRPVDQIRTAFLSEAEMMRFIDGIYLAIENQIKVAEEGLVSQAVSTAMAYDIENGMARNLLAEYLVLNPDSTITAATCLSDADFLRYAGYEIKTAIDAMQSMGKAFNSGSYMTFTDRDNLVCEMLGRYADASDVYLSADTFHNELVALPRYERVSRWQYMSNDTAQTFLEVSAIKIKHSALTGGSGAAAHIVNQSGIIAFVHDIEHVAAYFGHRRSWEIYNPRDDVYVHGETARKGYAVDPNANGIVFYVEDTTN